MRVPACPLVVADGGYVAGLRLCKDGGQSGIMKRDELNFSYVFGVIVMFFRSCAFVH